MCVEWVIRDLWQCGVHQRAELNPSPTNLESREAGAQRLQTVSMSLYVTVYVGCNDLTYSKLMNRVHYILFQSSFHSFLNITTHFQSQFYHRDCIRPFEKSLCFENKILLLVDNFLHFLELFANQMLHTRGRVKRKYSQTLLLQCYDAGWVNKQSDD